MSLPNALTTLSPLHPHHPATISRFFKFVSLFLFCKQVHLYHFLDPHVRNAVHLSFSVWLTSLSMTLSRSIHVAADGIISLFGSRVIFHCVHVPRLYPFLCQWTFRLLLCLGYCKQCCNEPWGYRYPFGSCFSQDMCPGVGLQDHTLFLVFYGTSILISIVTILIYIPTNRVEGFPSLHTFSIYLLSIF